MVSPASRRRAVNYLLGVGHSRHRSCRLVGLTRNASRYISKPKNPKLYERVLELSKRYPRFGFRRIALLIPGTNLKAVHRIWKLEGLRLNRRVRRRIKREPQPRIVLTKPNQVWAMDFVHQRLENGQQVRIFTVLDCFTRECLLLKAEVHYPAWRVQKELEWLFLVYGKPQQLLSDNGPEFRSVELLGVERAFIQPGKPWQNGRVESFFDKLRDEILNREIFDDRQSLQVALEEHQDFYNSRRPHLGLRGQTPLAFKGQWDSGKLSGGVLTL